MTVAEQTALVVAGPCRGCGCGQWDHRQGRRGCKEPECGCAKYLPPKVKPPAPADDWPLPTAEVESAEAAGLVARAESPANEAGVQVSAVERAEPERTRAELVADLTAQSIELGTYDLVVPVGVRTPSTCAYPNGEDNGEHDHALCEDVVAERVEQATDTESVYCADERCAQADLARRRASHERQMRLAAERDEARDERDGARVQRDQAYERVEEQDVELGRIRAALGVDVNADLAEAVERLLSDRDAQALAAEQNGSQLAMVRELDSQEIARLTTTVTRLRDELDRANAGRQRVQEQLDDAIRTGAAAATRVLWRYDAEQCEQCGSRYTEPVDHEHPLTPVTVLIVRREVAG